MCSAQWVCVLIIFSMSPVAMLNGPVLNLQWRNQSCIGGERGLLSVGMWLSLTASDRTDVCSSAKVWIEYNSSLPDLNFYLGNCSTILNVSFELEQPEHGGGLCHCVSADFEGGQGASFK